MLVLVTNSVAQLGSIAYYDTSRSKSELGIACVLTNPLGFLTLAWLV